MRLQIGRKVVDGRAQHREAAGHHRRTHFHRAGAGQQHARDVRAATGPVGADQGKAAAELAPRARQPIAGQGQGPGPAVAQVGVQRGRHGVEVGQHAEHAPDHRHGGRATVARGRRQCRHVLALAGELDPDRNGDCPGDRLDLHAHPGRSAFGRYPAVRSLVAIRSADVEFKQADAGGLDGAGQRNGSIEIGKNQTRCDVGVLGSGFAIKRRHRGDPVRAGAWLQAGPAQHAAARSLPWQGLPILGRTQISGLRQLIARGLAFVDRFGHHDRSAGGQAGTDAGFGHDVLTGGANQRIFQIQRADPYAQDGAGA